MEKKEIKDNLLSITKYLVDKHKIIYKIMALILQNIMIMKKTWLKKLDH